MERGNSGFITNLLRSGKRKKGRTSVAVFFSVPFVVFNDQ